MKNILLATTAILAFGAGAAFAHETTTNEPPADETPEVVDPITGVIMPITEIRFNLLTAEELEELIRQLATDLPALSSEERRAYIEELVARIRGMNEGHRDEVSSTVESIKDQMQNTVRDQMIDRVRNGMGGGNGDGGNGGGMGGN